MKLFAYLVLLVLCGATVFAEIRQSRTIGGHVYKLTPAGWVYHECIHEVPSGSLITEDEQGQMIVLLEGKKDQVKKIPRCQPPHPNLWNFPNRNGTVPPRYHHQPLEYDGWLSYTTFQYPAGIDKFLGVFSIPNNPQSVPEVLYIFTGLQNVDWIPIVDPEPNVFDIIQPVLQYPANSGSDWSVRSWYVTLDEGVVVSDEVECQSGDSIFGNMTRTGSQQWYIGSTVVSNQQTTQISVDRARLRLQPWAYNTIEGYGVEGCSYEPTNTCQFSKLQLYKGASPVTPTWVTHRSPNPKCNEQAHVNSPDNVYFTFQ